jgi:hypothetical protein
VAFGAWDLDPPMVLVAGRLRLAAVGRDLRRRQGNATLGRLPVLAVTVGEGLNGRPLAL